MRTVAKVFVPACMGLSLMLWASPLNAKVMNATGTWKLNVEKSEGKGPAPKSVMLKVVHKEPALKYSVTVTDAEGKPSSSEFDGAIDGKPYKETDGATTTYKRIDDSTIEGKSTSADAKTTATFTSTVSKDGKVITRKGTLKEPAGESKILEVWEKQ